MLRRTTASLVFRAKALCDVRNETTGKCVRMKVVPNPVSSFSRLPYSAKGMLGMGDPEVERAEAEKKRAMIRDLLRQGEESKQVAATLVSQLRRQAGSSNAVGPVILSVVGRDGKAASIETFVAFGTEQ
eukprot:Sspe_Gene.88863::Locus_60783_Transcript_1_1_Confidence_1.000_Length_412::g.88863::m.88863